MKTQILLFTAVAMVFWSCSDFNYLEQQMDLVDLEESLDEQGIPEDDDPFARKGGQTSTSQNFALKFTGQWKSEYVLTATGKWTVDSDAAKDEAKRQCPTCNPGQINTRAKALTDADYCACNEEPETCKYWTLELSDPNNTTVGVNVELAGISALVNNRHSKFSLDLSTLSEEGEKIPRVLDFSYSINDGPFIALDNQGLIWSGNVEDCKDIEDWVYANTSEPTNHGTAAYHLIKGIEGKKVSEILHGDDFHGNDDVCNHAEMYKGRFVMDLLNLNEGENTITIRAIVKGNEQSVDADVSFTKDIKITGNTPNC